MTRMLTLLHQDTRLQQRHGFYYAAVFVALVWIALLWSLPASLLPIAVPFIIFTDLGIVGFYFMAGTILMEKEENTLAALVVTPMRFGEYLAAKLVTLTLLAVVLSLLVAVATYGTGFNWLMLAGGGISTSLLTLLVGFISVAPYHSISSYIMPSQLYLLPLSVPLLPFFGVWEHPLFYVFPTHGSLLMLRAAFEPIAAWQVAYALSYQLLWVVALAWLAYRAFNRHIVARKGGA
jgi:fluoroquinolone transport system permease protein